jgi:MoaA/NifB/PqqE/SkfB family radical SAM enzyme
MQIKYAPIEQVYFELTNHCNFNCTFCPNELMSREQGYMKKDFAMDIIDQIADIKLTKKLIFHLMGEPTLHPDLIELMKYALNKDLKVILNTNGSLLGSNRLKEIYRMDLEKLIISYQTPTEETFRTRKAGLDFETYVSRLKQIIRNKYEYNSGFPIELHLLNSVDAEVLGLGKKFIVLDNENRTREVVEDWISYGNELEKRFGLTQLKHRRNSLEKLSLQKGFSYEVVKDVFLVSRKLTTWANTMVGKEKIIPGVIGSCDGLLDQFGILWDGSCVLCCMDFDGRTTVGNLHESKLSDIWLSRDLELIRYCLSGNILAHPYCRLCRGGPTKRSWILRQFGSIMIYRFGYKYIYSD